MEQRSEDIPVLVAQAGPLNGEQWMLNGDLLVGRDLTCGIVIPDRQVSRHHARFSLRPDGIFVEDLGSKNGTHFNGERLAGGTYLTDGDVIQIALAQEFVFISADSTMPLGDADQNKSSRPGNLRLEKRSRRVWIGDKEIAPPLSVAQFELLEILFERDGRVVTRKELIDEVWGEDEALGVSNQALDALIRRLRDRLAEVDPQHEYVMTVRGHGLRLENASR